VARTTLAQVRKIALGLPEATEQDHHGMPSFRVRGKIFATVPDDHHVRVMLDEEGIRAAVAEHPDSCAPGYWGKRLACAVIDLEVTAPALVQELLTDAWTGKAPPALSARRGDG
jgi:hypothetical protein